MALDSRDYEWYISQIHLLGGEEKAREYMKQLARQEIQIRDGHGLLAQLLAAGEFPLQLTLRDELAEDLIKSGAPIDWVAFEPVIPNAASGVGMARNPPHPNAARLFIDFVLSRESQEAYQREGRTATRTDLESPNERIRKLKYGQIDWATYFGRLNKYEKEYDELFVKRRILEPTISLRGDLKRYSLVYWETLLPVAATDGIATYYEVYGSGPALLMMGSGSFDSTVERFATNEWKGIRPFETFAEATPVSLRERFEAFEL
jgi:extracellular solute-binding protein